MTATLTAELTFCQTIINDQDYTAEYRVMSDGTELINEWCYGDLTNGNGISMPVAAYLAEYPGRTWLVEMARRDYASAYPELNPSTAITVAEQSLLLPTFAYADNQGAESVTAPTITTAQQMVIEIGLGNYELITAQIAETLATSNDVDPTTGECLELELLTYSAKGRARNGRNLSRYDAAWKLVESGKWQLPTEHGNKFQIHSETTREIYNVYCKSVKGHLCNQCDCRDHHNTSNGSGKYGGWCKHALAALILYYAALLFKQEHSRPAAECVAA